MKKTIFRFCLSAIMVVILSGCGTFLFIGPDGIGVPKERPDSASEYCLFISTQVLAESRDAVKGTAYAGVLAESRYNLYSHNIFWILDYSSDNFADIKKRLVDIGFDSPIITKPEQLPYFSGSYDGSKACYVKKY
ncbi:hypothetical protein FACS189450_08040 [Spirochaetia bacterium]|nr:hypothetical protein FACS189450_08040 [Spirochaetia bacterium]GHU92696.1 hypothetical protein FACS189479_02400 [Spirochaetia bacterium]